MPINYGDTKTAMLAVVVKLGRYIPGETTAILRERMLTTKHSREFFVILDDETWAIDLTNFYNSFFSRIIGTGLLERLLIYCHGFTTPLKHKQRRLFIPASCKYGTLVHEFVHWLQHTNAYPTFYQNDPDGPFFLEGITEYFTRSAYQGEDRRGHYEAQFTAVTRAIQQGAVTVDQIAAFSFQGAAFPEALRQFNI